MSSRCRAAPAALCEWPHSTSPTWNRGGLSWGAVPYPAIAPGTPRDSEQPLTPSARTRTVSSPRQPNLYQLLPKTIAWSHWSHMIRWASGKVPQIVDNVNWTRDTWDDVHPGHFLHHQRKKKERKMRKIEDKEKRYRSQLWREHNERWHGNRIVQTQKARSNKSKISQSRHREEGGETTTQFSPALIE